ncbi:MAG: hypothetical protein U9P38_00190 [Campylobacterota bacterium]|nr:hypothetical protein [Campylobacterota bacterium]
MKSLLISLIILLAVSGCQESSHTRGYVPTLNHQKSGVNENSLAYRTQEIAKEQKNRVEISKINSDTQIEIAKIESENRLKIAEIDADAKKDVAHKKSVTEIKTSEIDALTSKATMQNRFYITLAIIFSVTIAFILLFINNKKNRDLKNKLYQDQLRHEEMLKEREYEERRLIKMLDLVSDGKLSPIMEEEIILSLTQPKHKQIEDIQVIEPKEN